jgi:hypothetical protein
VKPNLFVSSRVWIIIDKPGDINGSKLGDSTLGALDGERGMAAHNPENRKKSYRMDSPSDTEITGSPADKVA